MSTNGEFAALIRVDTAIVDLWIGVSLRGEHRSPVPMTREIGQERTWAEPGTVQKNPLPSPHTCHESVTR